MLKILIKHELLQQIYSLRFSISLALVVLMFGISTMAFVFEIKDLKQNQANMNQKSEALKKDVASNISKLAIQRFSFTPAVRDNSFISNCSNLDISFAIYYSAYNVFNFELIQGKTNPFILPSRGVNWEFIIVLLFSFLAIVFAYDSISGEKESKTLALSLSNPVSRLHILFSKFAGITITLSFFLIIGGLLSLAILVFSQQIVVSSLLLAELFVFVLFAILLTACFITIGLFSSVICYYSNHSLLISLSVWLFFMFVVPHTALLLTDKLFKVEKKELVQERISKSRKAIEASFPNGKWHSEGNDPFCPDHQIRAKMMMAFMDNEKKYNDNAYNQMFNQFKNARKLSSFSPVSVFEAGNELLLDGGFNRFLKNWNALHSFQLQYLQWFKAIESKDNKSPHWLNPYEDYSTSKQAVKFETIPIYSEPKVLLKNRFNSSLIYFLILLLYTGVMLFVSLVRFVKYDVR